LSVSYLCLEGFGVRFFSVSDFSEAESRTCRLCFFTDFSCWRKGAVIVVRSFAQQAVCQIFAFFVQY
jgi:hypothetical protein